MKRDCVGNASPPLTNQSSIGDEAIRITTNKGLDISIPGRPDQTIDADLSVTKAAVLGTDYIGLKPRVLVEPGETVALGQPLFIDKRDPDVAYTSPATGLIVAVNRGRRRALQSVVVEIDEAAATEITFDPDQARTPSAVRDLLLATGLWTGLRTRPFNRVAPSAASPGAVFVTAIDTRPLAADPDVVVSASPDEFRTGIDVLRRLGDWPLYLCTGPSWSTPVKTEGVKQVEFHGPHPAGLAGTHIHHLHPVSAERSVWHIGYQDVIAIGHLFNTGRLRNRRVISIAGPFVVSPRLVTAQCGASIAELMRHEIETSQSYRLISGSPLDGVKANGPLAFLGRYHNQVSVLQEHVERRLFDWLNLRSVGRRFDTGHSGETTTASHGRQAAMFPVGAFERVIPMDILPVPLLRAMLVLDTDTAQALGCLELAEEDLALSSFVCPGKQDYASALRMNLDQIARDG